MESNDFVKCRKVSGKHHMFCPVKRRKVVLGKGQPDGDVAFLSPTQAAAVMTEKSWEVLEGGAAPEAVMMDNVEEPKGAFVLKERSPGWWDVINTGTGEPVNTTALRKVDAEAMLAEQPTDEEPAVEGVGGE